MVNIPKKVIVHCLATPDKKDTEGSLYDIKDVRQWHLDRGWNDVGYHWVITREGELQKGRDEEEVGAHCYGQNEGSIGVAYEGSFFPTLAQVKTLCDLYRQIRSVHGIDWADWEPHYVFSDKECPGFIIEDLHAILKKLPV